MEHKIRVSEYVDGVLADDRALLAKTITLVESRNPLHRSLADDVLTALLPYAGRAHRIGISGLPGAGKSSFIDLLGYKLVQAKHKVAVLAVDPSSHLTGGSILGDKTRMNRLTQSTNAFIRPSPTAGSLGGVTQKTRETMIVCEAAGYDIVFIETVGVGQTEVAVADMVDTLLVLLIAGAGDELQGIKRGLFEVANVVGINKADGDNKLAADKAKEQLATALHIMQCHERLWQTPVLTCSVQDDIGVDILWEKLCEHKQKLISAGILREIRNKQQLKWMWQLIQEKLHDAFHGKLEVKALLAEVEREVVDGKITASTAATKLLRAFGL